MARGARKSQRRFGGALEPFHTLRVRLEEREHKEMLSLAEASLDRVRHQLVVDLSRMEAAGRALGWVLRAAPSRTAEADVWREVDGLLDRLDDAGAATPASSHLALGGLRLLQAFGWGLDLARCVRCGRECEHGKAAMLDPAAGGLVCRQCGGARIRLSGKRRMRLLAAIAGDATALDPEDVATALDLVEQGIVTHVQPR
jgi:DNA repair protein RecO (recombination protein O)